MLTSGPILDDAQLAYLDTFEGCPDLYQRRLEGLSDGTAAWVYVLNPERVDAAVADGAVWIPGGSWKRWIEGRGRSRAT